MSNIQAELRGIIARHDRDAGETVSALAKFVNDEKSKSWEIGYKDAQRHNADRS